MANNNVSFDLELAVKDFNRNLNKTNNNLSSFHNSFKNKAKTSSIAWGSFVGNLGAKAFTSAITGLTKLANSMGQFTQNAISAAIDAQEVSSKFGAVFSDIETESAEMAKELQKNFGLGVTESKDLLSATGDLLTGFGFAQDAALNLSGEVQKLSVDLASFTNFSGGAEGASKAITKALLGEREALKSLGVSIQEKNVKEQVAINRANGLTFATERQAKAQATLDLITKQSKNAIGDYGRTSDSTANQLRLLKTRLEDLSISIGDKLIPVVKPIIDRMIDWIEANKDFLAQKVEEGVNTLKDAFFALKDNLDKVETFAKIALTALIAFKTISTATTVVTGFTTAIVALKAALVALSGPVGIAVTAITALGGAVAFALSQGEDSETVDNINKLKVATDDLADLQQKLNEAQERGASPKIIDSIKDRIKARDAEIKQLREARLLKSKQDIDLTLNRSELIQENLNRGKKKDSSKTGKDGDAEKAKTDDEQNNEEQIEKEKSKFEKLEQLNRNHQDKKALIREEARIRKKEIQEENEEADLEKQNEKRELAIERRLEFEQKKIDLNKQKEIEKAKRIKDDNKRKIAIQEANNKASLKSTEAKVKAEIKLEENKVKQKEKLQQREQRLQQGALQATQGFLSAGLQLAKKGSKERKALAIADATINTFAAGTRAFKDFPYPANLAVLASTIAQGLAQVDQITSTGNFERGGIVPGSSFTGDTVQANLNSGEMVLNRGQQSELFRQINNGSGGDNTDVVTAINDLGNRISNMEIVLQADDSELARSTSRGVQDGIVIGESR